MKAKNSSILLSGTYSAGASLAISSRAAKLICDGVGEGLADRRLAEKTSLEHRTVSRNVFKISTHLDTFQNVLQNRRNRDVYFLDPEGLA